MAASEQYEATQRLDFMVFHINRQKVEFAGVVASTRMLSSVRIGTLMARSGAAPGAMCLRSRVDSGPAR